MNINSTPSFTSCKIPYSTKPLYNYIDTLAKYFEPQGFGSTTSMQEAYRKIKPHQAAFIYDSDGVAVLGKTKEADTLIGKLLKSIDPNVQYNDDFDRIGKSVDLTI